MSSENSDIEFVDGLFFKLPHDNAPDFVKGKLSIKPREMIEWLQKRVDDEWVNLDLKVAKSGKAYAAVDTWKPNESQGGGSGGSRGGAPSRARPAPATSRESDASFEDDDIPFIAWGR
jgi:hypothetical protein